MTKVIVIGAGIAGISAAVGARKAGAEVTLLERQDQLLGIGRIAGSMDVGGRYPLHLEIIEMGAPEVNEVLDSVCLPNVENYRKSHYPHHSLPGSEEMTKHSWVYNVLTAEPALRKLLVKMDVEIRWRSRVVDVEKQGNHITRVKLAKGEWIEGDAFIDTTGSAGGQDHCIKDVGGCVMCPWMQCTTFGNRVDISGKAGATTLSMRQKDGRPGIKYNGLYLYKHSLAKELIEELNRNHQIFVPFRGLVDWDVDPEWSWGTRGQDGNDGSCMASCELNVRYPDYFAASLLVSGQWNPETMAAKLTRKNLFIALSEGGPREFPGMNAVVAALEAAGAKVARGYLNARQSKAELNADVKKLIATGANVLYAIYDAQTVLPDDGKEYLQMAHHHRGWEITYDIEAIRDWLFSQVRRNP